MTINRIMEVIANEVFTGSITINFYHNPTKQQIKFAASSVRILDASFDGPESENIAILSEDQVITQWKIQAKPRPISSPVTIGDSGFTQIRWNPYEFSEIVAFSEKKIFLYRSAVFPTKTLLNLTGSEKIKDIFFIYKSEECIFKKYLRLFNINKRHS